MSRVLKVNNEEKTRVNVRRRKERRISNTRIGRINETNASESNEFRMLVDRSLSTVRVEAVWLIGSTYGIVRRISEYPSSGWFAVY